MNKYDIAIIGGGAAGIMAAITAGEKCRNIVLIERNPELGKKILATGNGRCNLTNSCIGPEKYHGANTNFIQTVLASFNQNKTKEFFENLGVILKEEDNGRIFPRSNQAESIVNALLDELRLKKINTKINSLVRKISKNQLWNITLENGEKISSEKLIIATGGKSSCQYGSSGDGYYWASALGHKIVDTYPALTPVETSEDWIKEAQGIKVEGMVSTKINGEVAYKKTGDILFTHFGISGPAAMAQARFIAPKIGDKVKINIDLFPNETENNFDNQLKKIIENNGAKSIKNCIGGIVPNKLANIILKKLDLDPDKKSAEISKAMRLQIVKFLKNIEFTPAKIRPFKESQVTAGGIDISKIDPLSMESKIVPNLYFAGEIVDVDGESGGYNLQWAWSSGHLAGEASSK